MYIEANRFAIDIVNKGKLRKHHLTPPLLSPEPILNYTNYHK